MSICPLLVRRELERGLEAGHGGQLSYFTNHFQPMRYMMMWKPADNAASQNPPTPELMAAIDELMADMTRTGAIIDAGGMYPPTSRLRLAGGKITTLDGPFAETKELIGGYCVVRADSPEEAVAMARRFVQIHADHGYEGESEIRQLMHAEDFAAPAAP